MSPAGTLYEPSEYTPMETHVPYRWNKKKQKNEIVTKLNIIKKEQINNIANLWSSKDPITYVITSSTSSR